MWANFHTHCSYCDGKTGLHELINEAKFTKMKALGISSHAPLPFEKPWAMKHDRLKDYISEIKSLKHNTSDFDLYAGLEIDYIPGKISPSDFAPLLDYTIGSIHFVEDHLGEPWEIDNTHQIFLDGLENIFKGNITEAITRYYELTRDMLSTSKPDVLGHMDKIKIQNPQNKFFREDDTWYKDAVMKTIEVIRQNDIIVEVNTRGMYQKKSETTYPSPWIIEALCNQKVRITISSDAHHPKDLSNCFPETAKMLATMGLKTIHILHEGSWKPYRFDENGIVD